jgi:thiol-disulfide isomerase/thioredoxin
VKKYFFAIVIVIVIGLTGIVIGLAAAHSRRTTAPSDPSHSAVLTPGSSSAAAPGTGSKNPQDRVILFASNPIPAPPFLVTDLDGQPISTAEWHGKVVLLNFWATWCPPCREEIPEMIELANRYKDRLQIIGVSMDDGPPEEVRQFAKEIGINYPIVMWSRELIREYGGVPGLPTSFVINPEGRVVQKHVGLYSMDVYEGEVRALLGLPVNATVQTFQDTGQIFLKNAALATELPGVDFKGLNEDQKRLALKRLNSQTCNCGCTLTLAECRINDTSCPISRQLAAAVVKDILNVAKPDATAAEK